jgi:CheY-like chemotaxis protein
MTDDGLRRVLVAQSQPADRQFTCRFLKVLGGYAVNEASDGLGMIKALKNGPDVIIADTNQGAQFPRAIEIIKRNKAFQETPIVIYSEEQHLAPGLAAKGISGFIVKPAAPAALLGKLWKVLGEGECSEKPRRPASQSVFKRTSTESMICQPSPLCLLKLTGYAKIRISGRMS